MANLKIPSEYSAKKVLIADDEREHIEFLVDYLREKGFQVTFAENAKEALDASELTRYRAYFIDLNIPFGDLALDNTANTTFSEYPGLHIIQAIRSQGNSGARVVAYSAHYNQQIATEIEKLYCKYIVKGRAKELKAEIAVILSADPLIKQENAA
jgi:CheY-like chemotaxis protein